VFDFSALGRFDFPFCLLVGDKPFISIFSFLHEDSIAIG